jgi:uncharacterized protein (TIGR00369 family)
MSIDPHFSFTQDHQARIPFVAHLGLTTEALGQGTARLSMPLAPHFTNSFGTAHGGVIMALLDVALCTAARTLHPDAAGVITIDLNTSFLDAGIGPKLIAEARVLRNGRSTIFVEGEARNENGLLVAKAVATMRAWTRQPVSSRGAAAWTSSRS